MVFSLVGLYNLTQSVLLFLKSPLVLILFQSLFLDHLEDLVNLAQASNRNGLTS